MKVTISNEVVRKNIELFQLLVKRQALKEMGKKQLLLHAFINRKTGDIRYVKENEKMPEDQWKPICIQISLEGAFEIIDEEKKETFAYNDLQPLAYGIMVETIHTLNHLTSKFPKASGVGEVLEEISQCQIAGAKTLPKDLVHDAWHQADRLGAEKLLEDCPVGTYLFRKDEYAALLEEELKIRWGEEISCFTLTYSEEDGKVTDQTIVKKGDKWLFYDDDPSLSGKTHPTVYALLSTLKKKLVEPLLY